MGRVCCHLGQGGCLLSCADNRIKGNAQAGFGLDLQFSVAALKTFLSPS